MSRSRICAIVLLVTACSSASEPSVAAPTTGQPRPTRASTAVPAVPEAAGPRLAVPDIGGEPPPAVDGTIGEEEWAGAAEANMDDGTRVRFLYRNGHLFVAIHGAELGSANLLIAEDGAVRVLHSSAALGTARYEPDGEEWRLIEDFVWCCRSVAGAGERQTLLEENGWQASIGFAGMEGEVEFQVLIDDDPPVAISYVLADGSVAAWPPDLDASARRQVFGERRPVEQFQLDQWGRLAIPAQSGPLP